MPIEPGRPSRSGRHNANEVDAALQEWMQRRGALAGNRERNLAVLVPAALAGRIRLLTHDPVDRADIAEARSWGASIAEFPTTVEAASAARDAGMPTVLGAPNVLRGGSHSGNVSAEELVARDLVTILSSDYQPTTLLAAAFVLARNGTCSLARAAGLVTAGPAEALGLDDRGCIELGRRADLLLVSDEARWPTVRDSFRAHDPILAEV